MDAHCEDGLLSLDTDDKHNTKKWMTEMWKAFKDTYYHPHSTSSTALIKIVHIYEKYQIGQLHRVWNTIMFRLEEDEGHKKL